MKKQNAILLTIMILTLAVRLYFAFSTPNISYESYFAVRQIEHIKHTGLPLMHDTLSDRVFVFSPAFHYITALFSLILPTIVALKILTNIFAVLLIPMVYLIAREITRKKSSALFSAFLAAFIPIFFSKTINSASVYSLSIPLIFLAIYYFMKINENKRYIYYFVAITFILPLINTLAFLFILGLLVFVLLTRIEKLRIKKTESEAILFSIIAVFWLSFIIFKQAFLKYGFQFIWQNMPAQLLATYFPSTTILTAVYDMGVIPFITGIFVIYSYLFIKKNKNLYLLISFAVAAAACLWLKIIQAETGLIILGVIFSVFFAVFYEKFFSIGLVLPILVSIFYKDAIKKMKKVKVSHKIPLTILFIILLVSAILPCIRYARGLDKFSPIEQEMDALAWIRENSGPHDLIAATLEEGYLINYAAERPTITDLNFLLMEDSQQRFEDNAKILGTPFNTVAGNLLEKYDVRYIYFSRNAAARYKTDEPRYIDDECFDLVYDKGVKIYEPKCI